MNGVAALGGVRSALGNRSISRASARASATRGLALRANP